MSGAESPSSGMGVVYTLYVSATTSLRLEQDTFIIAGSTQEDPSLFNWTIVDGT